MKRYCSAGQAAAAIDAVCDVVDRERIEAGAISEIAIKVPHHYLAMIDRADVSDRIASLLSAQYQVAAAIVHREDLYDCARSSLRTDAEFARLKSLVTIEADEALAESYPHEWPASVRLVAGGSTHESTSVRRSPDPDWDIAKIGHKATRMFAVAGIGASVDRLCELVSEFEVVSELTTGLASLAGAGSVGTRA
jgi:hypothetical protein